MVTLILDESVCNKILSNSMLFDDYGEVSDSVNAQSGVWNHYDIVAYFDGDFDTVLYIEISRPSDYVIPFKNPSYGMWNSDNYLQIMRENEFTAEETRYVCEILKEIEEEE